MFDLYVQYVGRQASVTVNQKMFGAALLIRVQSAVRV